MNLVLRAAAATLAAVALTPAVAHAQQPYSVDFGWTPQSPTVGETTTLRAATTTSDVTWDFDGDGSVDARGPVVDHQFATAGEHRVTVTASWPGAVPINRTATRPITVQGATAPTPTPTATATPVITPAATPVATPAPCPTTFTAGKLVATAPCFQVTGGRHRSSLPVVINGIVLTPNLGTTIELETTRTGTFVRAANARVTINQLVASTGKLEWSLVGDKLTGFKTATGAHLGGMKLAGTPTLTVIPGAKAQLQTRFALPAKLGGGLSDQPVAVRTGTQVPPILFKVQHGGLPGLSLSELTVRYDGGDSWSVDAKVQLPQPIGLKVTGGLSIKNGAFSQLYSSTSLGSKHGPVHLKRLSFAVEADPAKSKCKAPGALMAMCGELGLTAGPSLLGAPALSLDGGFGFNLYESKPSVLKAYGKVKLAGMTLKDAEFEMRDTGYVGVKSKLDLGWDGIATIKGSSSIEFQGTKFNGESKDQVCLEFVDYCLGAETLISTKGLAACLTVDLWAYDWHPGIGVKWGHGPDLYWSGCDLAPYRETFAKAAAAGDHAVRLPAGLPGAAIAVTGAERVVLVGPKGERLETPAGLRPLTTKDFFVMKTPQGLTQIAIRRPSAGTWKVRALEGTITSVKSANGLAKPSVKAKVRKGRLHYTVKRVSGQIVRFTQGGRELGRAKGAKGTLRIKGKGPITALIEQDGRLRDRVTIKR